MTHEQFCYWLQGFAESNKTSITAEQWQTILSYVPVKCVKSLDFGSVQLGPALDPFNKFPNKHYQDKS